MPSVSKNLFLYFFAATAALSANALDNRVTFGMGYAKPKISGIEISGRGAFQLSYHRKLDASWTFGVGLEGGLKEYDCAVCSNGKATENLTTLYVTSDYSITALPGLYVGPRVGTAMLSTEVPVAGTTYVSKGSDFAVGLEVGYLYDFATAWSVGAEASFTYIFSDRTAWIAAGVATISWSF